jgi:hypothetical protein
MSSSFWSRQGADLSLRTSSFAVSGKGVTAIVFGSRRREAVSETVELLGILGIDGEDSDAAIHERLDDRPMRCLDSDSNVVRPLCLRGKPVDHYADQTRATWTVCVGR